jgi:hypothetical protein
VNSRQRAIWKRDLWTAIKQHTKEHATAYYDPEKNKIYNCEQYGHAWFHEKRHMTQFSVKPIFWINYVLNILTNVIGVFAIYLWLLHPDFSLGMALVLVGVPAMAWAAVIFLLEVDAWVVGTWQWWLYNKR